MLQSQQCQAGGACVAFQGIGNRRFAIAGPATDTLVAKAFCDIEDHVPAGETPRARGGDFSRIADVRRTTRATSITREGELFYENCRPGVDRILQALEEMRDLREGPPRGRLKISAPHGFGRKVVAPLMAEFRARFPAVTLELLLEEGTVNLAADGVDVAFRDGRLDDSQIIAKQLIPMQMHICASPGYARQHGLPHSVDDIAAHSCINQRLANGRLQCWDFKIDGQIRSITPDGNLIVNDPSLAMRAVLDGQGLAQLPAYQASEALRKGTLVACLAHVAPDDRGHYVCYLSRQQLPKRIRAFIDFMTTSIRALDLYSGIGLGAHRSNAAPELPPPLVFWHEPARSTERVTMLPPISFSGAHSMTSCIGLPCAVSSMEVAAARVRVDGVCLGSSAADSSLRIPTEIEEIGGLRNGFAAEPPLCLDGTRSPIRHRCAARSCCGDSSVGPAPGCR
jgi:DNA-binding transcriptional LysR family regulator